MTETIVDAFELTDEQPLEENDDAKQQEEEVEFYDEEELQKINAAETSMKRKEEDGIKSKSKKTKHAKTPSIVQDASLGDPLILKTRVNRKVEGKQPKPSLKKEEVPHKSVQEISEKYCIYMEMSSDKASKMKKELEHLQTQWPQMYFQITKNGLRALNLNGDTRNLFVSIEWPASFFSTFFVESECLLHFEEALLIKRLCNVEKFDSITFLFSKIDFEQHKSTMESIKMIVGHKVVPDAAKQIAFIKSSFSSLPHLELKLKRDKGPKRTHDMKTKVKILAKMIMRKESFWTTPIIEIRYPFILKDLLAEDFRDQIGYFIKNNVVMVYMITNGISLHLIGKPEKDDQSSPLHVIVTPDGAPSGGSRLPSNFTAAQVIADFESTLNAFNQSQNEGSQTPSDTWKGGEYSLAFLQSCVKCILGKDSLVSLFFGLRLPFVMKTFSNDVSVPVFTHIFNTNA